MAAPPGKAGEKKSALNPLTIEAQNKKELLIMKNFGPTWGSICLEAVPRSVEESIEMKKEQLAKLQAKAGTFALPPTDLSTTSGVFGEHAALPNPEQGYAKAYKAMKAGM
jgi:hypothetical protein